MNCFKCNKELKDNDTDIYELSNGEPCCKSCYEALADQEDDRHEEYNEQQEADEERTAIGQEARELDNIIGANE